MMWEACSHIPALSMHTNSSRHMSSSPFPPSSYLLKEYARHRNCSEQRACQAWHASTHLLLLLHNVIQAVVQELQVLLDQRRDRQVQALVVAGIGRSLRLQRGHQRGSQRAARPFEHVSDTGAACCTARHRLWQLCHERNFL